MKKTIVFTILCFTCIYLNAQTTWNEKYDINGDGKITMADVNLLMNIYLTQTDTVSSDTTKKDILEYVDLGLPSGTLWATCNLGATSPEKYGNYYAWGEVTPKDYFAEENCTTYGKSQGDSISGTQYDAATATLGKNWRIPNKQQFSELTAKCTWVRTTVNGFPVMKGTGPNGNTIILTLNGWINGYNYKELNNDIAYWVSEEKNDNLGCMIWGIGGTKFYSDQCNPKYIGQAIRPIYVKSDTVQTSSNLLPGKFSVSATKQVQFTKSNLYWDGSAFKFEENQTDYPTSWDANHVGHFYWTTLTDYQSGKTSNMPYALSYSSKSESESDKCWCGEENPLTVEGTSGLYALSGGSNGEWNYLINSRTNASNLRKYGVTVTKDGTSYSYCLIIAPDDFTGTLQSSYTLDEVNAAGLVCLPGAGNRNESSLINGAYRGYYWSATPYSDIFDFAYSLYFYSYYLYPAHDDARYLGNSLRLVRSL